MGGWNGNLPSFTLFLHLLSQSDGPLFTILSFASQMRNSNLSASLRAKNNICVPPLSSASQMRNSKPSLSLHAKITYAGLKERQREMLLYKTMI